MKAILSWYFRISLILRIFICFIAGSLIGFLLWQYTSLTDSQLTAKVIPWISPFGEVFVHMMKMVVIPVIFFSLLVGASSLPVSKFGRVGIKAILWYLGCSLLAAILGAGLALAINPGSQSLEQWQQMAGEVTEKAEEVLQKVPTENPLTTILLNMFQNPFTALATDNFLPIIVFSIMFGLAMRITIEASKDKSQVLRLEQLEQLLAAARDAMFRIVAWILEYSPIGVLALTIVNFSKYGPRIIGPYISVTLGVIAGIIVMVFIVYPVLLWSITRHHPFRILGRIREAMLMAFVTRSSAATLPVSMKIATEELKIHDDLASFSLPLGATINMDGVCVHLPMFAVLAANMFGIEMTTGSLFLVVITTVLSSIGAGGVPGGSLMLLFIVLETIGLSSENVATIVALALGINPILDMFETMNNVTGDLVCTYAVAHNEDLLVEEN